MIHSCLMCSKSLKMLQFTTASMTSSWQSQEHRRRPQEWDAHGRTQMETTEHKLRWEYGSPCSGKELGRIWNTYVFPLVSRDLGRLGWFSSCTSITTELEHPLKCLTSVPLSRAESQPTFLSLLMANPSAGKSLEPFHYSSSFCIFRAHRQAAIGCCVQLLLTALLLYLVLRGHLNSIH